MNNQKMKDKLAWLIKINREKRGMTQKDLADKIGVSRDTISLWECGRKVPGGLALVEIMNLFDIALEDIKEKEEEEKNDSLEEMRSRLDRAEKMIEKLCTLVPSAKLQIS